MVLQKAFTEIDLAKIGLPSDLALRIGAHYGPVTLATDPFTNRTTAYGSQVAYAARIEPLAVPGSIWVSEAFAATLALSPACGYTTAYVGRQNLRGVENLARLFALIASHEAM
jgi:class 3 adenylate cyclase